MKIITTTFIGILLLCTNSAFAEERYGYHYTSREATLTGFVLMSGKGSYYFIGDRPYGTVKLISVGKYQSEPDSMGVMIRNIPPLVLSCMNKAGQRGAMVKLTGTVELCQEEDSEAFVMNKPLSCTVVTD